VDVLDVVVYVEIGELDVVVYEKTKDSIQVEDFVLGFMLFYLDYLE